VRTPCNVEVCDDSVVEVAREAADRQQQNQVMARLRQ
jgi:hypothetical protein